MPRVKRGTVRRANRKKRHKKNCQQESCCARTLLFPAPPFAACHSVAINPSLNTDERNPLEDSLTLIVSGRNRRGWAFLSGARSLKLEARS